MLNFLNEELSISKKVERCSEDVINKLEILSDWYSKNVDFSYNFFGTDYQICFDRNEMNLQCNGSTDMASQRMFIISDCIEETRDIIYHEILHIYQYIKNKETYQNDKYYKIAREIMQGYGDEDKKLNSMDFLFALALYASFDFEQDAFIHGAYGKLKNEPKITDKMLSSTDAYLYIRDMNNALSAITFQPSSFNEKLFEMRINTYITIIKNGLERL